MDTSRSVSEAPPERTTSPTAWRWFLALEGVFALIYFPFGATPGQPRIFGFLPWMEWKGQVPAWAFLGLSAVAAIVYGIRRNRPNAPLAWWFLASGVIMFIAGDTIYLRGQIGQNLDTSENVGVGDVTAQAEQAMTNIDLLLREAGSALQDIVKVTVYLVDPRYREPVYRVMGRWLKGVYPVSTGLVVSALGRPEWLVEIDATAVRPATS